MSLTLPPLSYGYTLYTTIYVREAASSKSLSQL